MRLLFVADGLLFKVRVQMRLLFGARLLFRPTSHSPPLTPLTSLNFSLSFPLSLAESVRACLARSTAFR